MYVAERIEHEDKIILIMPDEDAESPRKWDNLGTMVCWHKRYDLGDRKPTENEHQALRRGGFRLLGRYLRRYLGVRHVLPLGLLDHSGLHMYAEGGPHWTATAGWDSGTVGWIMAEPENIAKMGTPDDRLDRGLEAEVEEYDQYLRGDVYGYIIRRRHDPECDDDDCPHHEELDSCWGFFGLDYCRQEALAAAGVGESEVAA